MESGVPYPPDQVFDRRGTEHDFKCRHTGFSVDRRQKLLGNYRLKNRCQLRADLVLPVRWEHIDNTLNGRCRTDGMQGGEYQMSGFCCCDGSGNRIKVTLFPHKDDVRILTERRTERISIGIGMQPISLWFTIERLCLCKYSIGSSSVMICSFRSLLMTSIKDASVVDLPLPVGPVTRTSPRFFFVSPRTASYTEPSGVGISLATIRSTAA